ncbi:hypothetical protein GCM10010250_04450 [Streptomyces althioticus]|nr:hypothetical protein GCM10010250_04450 [Streptomyces althioticus]
MMIAPWLPWVTFLSPIRPSMNSNLTVSSSRSANSAIRSNMSTDNWDDPRSAITVMVPPSAGGHQRDGPRTYLNRESAGDQPKE